MRSSEFSRWNDNDWLAPLCERQLIPADCIGALVVGSAARGWLNPRSDIDLYLVTTEEVSSDTGTLIPMSLNPPRVQSESFYYGGRRWEVTYWLERQVEQVLARVSWEEFGGETPAGFALGEREELLLARLGNCVPVLGADWVEEIQARLRDSAFRSFLVTRSLSSSDDAVEDAMGQLESGDLDSATLSARRALGFAVDALLESHGEYGSNIPKWRPQRLRAAQPDLLSFDQYWELETMRTYDAEDPGAWIRTILTLCQDISMRVEVS